MYHMFQVEGHTSKNLFSMYRERSARTARTLPQKGRIFSQTSEQVDAGVRVLTASGRVSPNLPDWAARELVRDILEAAQEVGSTDQEIEVTRAMIEAGAKELEEQLWTLDPFTKPYTIEVLKVILPRGYRSMAASADRK